MALGHMPWCFSLKKEVPLNMQLAPPLGILLGSEPPGLVMTNYLILFVSGFLEWPCSEWASWRTRSRPPHCTFSVAVATLFIGQMEGGYGLVCCSFLWGSVEEPLLIIWGLMINGLSPRYPPSSLPLLCKSLPPSSTLWGYR